MALTRRRWRSRRDKLLHRGSFSAARQCRQRCARASTSGSWRMSCDVVVPEPAAAAASSGGSSGGSGDSVGGAAAAAGANGAAARVAAALAKVERHREREGEARAGRRHTHTHAKRTHTPFCCRSRCTVPCSPSWRQCSGPARSCSTRRAAAGTSRSWRPTSLSPPATWPARNSLEQVADFALKCLEKEPGHLARFELGLVKLHRGDGLHGYNGVLFDAIAVTAKCDDATLARYASMPGTHTQPRCVSRRRGRRFCRDARHRPRHRQ